MTYQCPCGAFVALEELRRTPGGRYVCAECDHRMATEWGLRPVIGDGSVEYDDEGKPTVLYPPMRRRAPR